jgi:hypothetical protein
MAKQWDVQRSTITRPDAQQRWDTVYQFLLQWTSESVESVPAAPDPQEEHDGNRDVRPGLDPPPATGTDH